MDLFGSFSIKFFIKNINIGDVTKKVFFSSGGSRMKFEENSTSFAK
jgi:hypothetical protein